MCDIISQNTQNAEKIGRIWGMNSEIYVKKSILCPVGPYLASADDACRFCRVSANDIGSTNNRRSRQRIYLYDTRHIDKVGHYESDGTHEVMIEWCECGVHFRLGDPDDEARRREHYDPFGDIWGHFSMVETREEPNDPQYIVDTPAHDETYCTICGAIQ